MGRWGLHKETYTLIGSNTHNLARICTTNLLVVNESTSQIKLPTLEEEAPLSWSSEALAILERIPEFARPMAKRAIEKRARDIGAKIVEENLVNSLSDRMGMRKDIGKDD